jgi:methanogenic corrinoid protein MtbC1
MTPQVEAFITAILAGDLARGLELASAARERGLRHLYEEIVTPALVEVGRRWQRGEISVADEHVAAAMTQSVICAQYPTFRWPVGARKGIVACVPGERHELGARIAADLLVDAGWDVLFVGADVPLVALADRIRHERPAFVGLSVGMATRLPEVNEALALLRSAAPDVKWIVGGRAAAEAGGGALEADAVVTSASGAVDVLRSWGL